MISVCLSILNGEDEKNKFERLFHTYYQSMLKAAWLVTGSLAEAEEVVQEVFFKVTEIIDKFPETACKKERSLLIVMTRNKAIDVIRKKGRYPETALEEEELTEAPDNLEAGYIQREGAELILSLLEELPENYRSVLVLHIADGWTVAEIAEFLELSVHTVEVRLNRGKKYLQKLIRERMEDRLPSDYKNKGKGQKYE
ncbi:MAG: RNA polymerase sigma factor [Lachnospiraceae bacterium]